MAVLSGWIITDTCLKTSLEKVKLECTPESDDTTEKISKRCQH
jgi:hypothetical protein